MWRPCSRSIRLRYLVEWWILFLFTVATASAVSWENSLNNSGIFSEKSLILGVLAICFLSSSGSKYFWLKYIFCEVNLSISTTTPFSIFLIGCVPTRTAFRNPMFFLLHKKEKKHLTVSYRPHKNSRSSVAGNINTTSEMVSTVVLTVECPSIFALKEIVTSVSWYTKSNEHSVSLALEMTISSSDTFALPREGIK